MKITDVEAMVLDTGKNYADPQEAVEAHGVRFVALIKISTDAGICGWSDVETQPHVGQAIVNAPSGGQIGFNCFSNREKALIQVFEIMRPSPAGTLSVRLYPQRPFPKVSLPNDYIGPPDRFKCIIIPINCIICQDLKPPIPAAA